MADRQKQETPDVASKRQETRDGRKERERTTITKNNPEGIA
jgi:hypothetical protein